ncbi:sensor histidine kinase [Paenibacillus herberti]|uniref:histidine kinase n=1 Tax=Paenibacillus herberti TaxID=1619309 RepID=A0A229NTY2_9BACL|nr:histidine kinase [Paenibacillus herberti]OXM13326.1 sensor histidine kinase [Paenibacillus herberti]
MTLRRRIFLIFSVSSLVPFLSIFIISNYTIDQIFDNKIKSGINSNLRQVELSLGNSISNLNHVSQQLAYGNNIVKQIDEVLFQTMDPYTRLHTRDQLKNELNMVTFTNPNVGLTFYYIQNENKIQFENFPVEDNLALDSLPLLSSYYDITYFGPHESLSRSDDGIVLSALRKVGLPDRDNVYVYIETGFSLTQDILDNNEYGGDLTHLILDGNGRIAYSEVPETFKSGAQFPQFSMDEGSGLHEGYYWFKQTSNQNWSVVSVISKTNYNKEKDQWMVKIFFIALIFIALTILLAWLLWQMVYKPLNLFNSEIKFMSQNRMRPQHKLTKIPEFDYLLRQFSEMKKQIWNLFEEVELKEKKRIDLEVEKLLYQINPHFLMNTLDTVHWLAVINGQKEIDRLVKSLNKLLYYNLGKLGQVSTIEEEIDALKQYLVLQQIRYDFEFDVRIDVDKNVLKQPVPRFILQPLVENSLYHGLSDDGYIEVSVVLDKVIRISIHDNGAGMTEETIQEILNNRTVEHKKVGMGIGMNYVKRMLEASYENKASLEIKSEIGKGTSIFLTLPISKEKT